MIGLVPKIGLVPRVGLGEFVPRVRLKARVWRESISRVRRNDVREPRVERKERGRLIKLIESLCHLFLWILAPVLDASREGEGGSKELPSMDSVGRLGRGGLAHIH